MELLEKHENVYAVKFYQQGSFPHPSPCYRIYSDETTALIDLVEHPLPSPGEVVWPFDIEEAVENPSLVDAHLIYALEAADSDRFEETGKEEYFS